MITMSELNPKNVPLTEQMQANLKVLHFRLNQVRQRYAKPMIITSGVRSMVDHKRIYADIAKRKGSATIRVPMGSRHLDAAAADVLDRDGSLMEWCLSNQTFLAEIGLWIESGTVGWTHFQIYPPKSGKRFFKP